MTEKIDEILKDFDMKFPDNRFSNSAYKKDVLLYLEGTLKKREEVLRLTKDDFIWACYNIDKGVDLSLAKPIWEAIEKLQKRKENAS